MRFAFIGFVFLILFSSLALAITVTPAPPATSDNAVAQIAVISQDVKALQAQVTAMPTKTDFDTSFQQIDKKITEAGQNNALSGSALTVVVVILNDFILLGFYLISKTQGWFN